MYWKIEPYFTDEADYCVLPADSEADHRAALKYAQDRIEEIWDGLSLGEAGTITIELCEGEQPKGDV